VKQQIRNRGISQRRARMTTLCFINGINRKKAECINGKLIYITHERPLSAGFTRLKSWIEMNRAGQP
jgi:hypothetical protein